MPRTWTIPSPYDDDTTIDILYEDDTGAAWSYLVIEPMTGRPVKAMPGRSWQGCIIFDMPVFNAFVKANGFKTLKDSIWADACDNTSDDEEKSVGSSEGPSTPSDTSTPGSINSFVNPFEKRPNPFAASTTPKLTPLNPFASLANRQAAPYAPFGTSVGAMREEHSRLPFRPSDSPSRITGTASDAPDAEASLMAMTRRRGGRGRRGKKQTHGIAKK
ncbi:hypothetical protein F5Y18DRAFT_423429 [Xylariaceae sp. FL1019]|nr:hypothetical protein F5Y18DRAFT_423429 [Xylariaceae sp. FL1019]